MNGFKNIDVAQLQSMLAQGAIKLVDVRTDAEIARGYIAGADKLPLHLLPMRLHELNSTAPTVFYCQMGGVLHRLRLLPMHKASATYITCRAESLPGCRPGHRLPCERAAFKLDREPMHHAPSFLAQFGALRL